MVLASRSRERAASGPAGLRGRGRRPARGARPTWPTAPQVDALFDAARRAVRAGATPWCTPLPCSPTAGSRTSGRGLRPRPADQRSRHRQRRALARCGCSRRRAAGRLVVVGSLLGKIATPYMSSYVTAQVGACTGWCGCLQIEARTTSGIDISLVTPGGVNTPVYLQAGTYVRRHGRPPPPVVSPETGCGRHRPTRSTGRPARPTSVPPTRSPCSGSVSSQGFSTASSLR